MDRARMAFAITLSPTSPAEFEDAPIELPLRRAGVLADAVLQRKLRSLANVTVIMNAQTTEVTGDGEKVNGIVYKDRASGAVQRVELEGIFVQIGLLPNTDFIKGGPITLSKFGEIEVDSHGATTMPGVFAAGDVTTVPYKQIIIAMGEGSKAALGAFDDLIRRTPQHGDSSFANKNHEGTNEASKPRNHSLELRKAA